MDTLTLLPGLALALGCAWPALRRAWVHAGGRRALDRSRGVH